MKLAEYAKLWRLKTDLDWREHFNTNKFTGKGPVSITSCTDCDEILYHPHTVYHNCVEIQKRINTVLGGRPCRHCARGNIIFKDKSGKQTLSRCDTCLTWYIEDKKENK